MAAAVAVAVNVGVGLGVVLSVGVAVEVGFSGAVVIGLGINAGADATVETGVGIGSRDQAIAAEGITWGDDALIVSSVGDVCWHPEAAARSTRTTAKTLKYLPPWFCRMSLITESPGWITLLTGQIIYRKRILARYTVTKSGPQHLRTYGPGTQAVGIFPRNFLTRLLPAPSYQDRLTCFPLQIATRSCFLAWLEFS